MSDRVHIEKLRTGVPGLDEVLDGGLPEFSFNLIAGGPGCGKTTLAHQLVFANATPQRPALYVTVVGEPPLKMLRYQQQYSFFQMEKIPESVRFLHLGDTLVEAGLTGVLEAIVREVETTRPRIVVVDSFRSLVRRTTEPGELEIEHFVQRLGLHLTSWEATTFLVGEYIEHDDTNMLFSVADGILWMYQSLSRGSAVRQLQVLKVRGQGHKHGMHSLAIDGDGVRVFPRSQIHTPPSLAQVARQTRRSTGLAALDDMLGGGIPSASSVLISGPAGTGKTTLAHHFALAGCEAGERVVVAGFERHPLDFLMATPQAEALTRYADAGALTVLSLGPLDLSVDQTLAQITAAVSASGATRLVLDSLSGFEIALAAPYREDLAQSVYRALGALTRLGVTVMMITDAGFSPGTADTKDVSFLTDGVIALRYIETEAKVSRALCVVKLRNSTHSKRICEFDINDHGIVLGSRA